MKQYKQHQIELKTCCSRCTDAFSDKPREQAPYEQSELKNRAVRNVNSQLIILMDSNSVNVHLLQHDRSPTRITWGCSGPTKTLVL